MRAHAPQLARRRAQRGGRPAPQDLRYARQLDHALPAPRALLRQDHPGRLPGGRRRPRALAGCKHPDPGAARVPAHVPAGRAPGLREGLQQRAAAGVREQGKEPDLRCRRGDRDRMEQAGRKRSRRPRGQRTRERRARGQRPRSQPRRRGRPAAAAAARAL